jgi:hypothetical protein
MDITYEKRKAIKSQILPDFTAEWLELQNTGPPDLSSVWTMYFDGSKRVQGAGAGIVLISPQGDKLKYVLRMSDEGMTPRSSIFAYLVPAKEEARSKDTRSPQGPALRLGVEGKKYL